MKRSKPFRLLLEYNGVTTKMLSVFGSKDNSFYFHPYRPTDTPWMHIDAPKQDPEANGFRLDLSSFKPSSFTFSKVSFHPSGFIHLTDTNGARFKDGTRGPRFQDLKLPYSIAIFAPCDPTKLPLATPGKYRDFTIALPQDVLPFHISFDVVRSDQLPQATDGPMIRQPVNLLFADQPLALAMTMWPVRPAAGAPRTVWPAAPFHLLRTGA